MKKVKAQYRWSVNVRQPTRMSRGCFKQRELIAHTDNICRRVERLNHGPHAANTPACQESTSSRCRDVSTRGPCQLCTNCANRQKRCLYAGLFIIVAIHATKLSSTHGQFLETSSSSSNEGQASSLGHLRFPVVHGVIPCTKTFLGTPRVPRKP